MVLHSGKCFMCPTWVTAHRLAFFGVRKVFCQWGPEGHRQEARAVKTVKVSGRVAKPAWDQTVGGTHCVPSLQTGSQLGPNLVMYGFG